jgi:hypothetical protein
MKLTEIVEEGPLAMDGVEALGLLPAHVDALGRDHAKACFLEHLGDGAGEVAPGGVGLDDRESAFGRHGRKVSISAGDLAGSLGAGAENRKRRPFCSTLCDSALRHARVDLLSGLLFARGQ